MNITGQYLAEENAAGHTFSDLARKHDMTRGKVAGMVRRYKKENAGRKMFDVDFGAPWRLEGDWMVTGDVHIPCTNYDFSRLLLRVAKLRGLKRLVVAGDFFTFDFMSRYQSVVNPFTWAQERDAARFIIKEWLGWFDEIRFLMGNHDRRMQRWSGGEFDGIDIFELVQNSERCHVSNWGWCVIDTPAEYPWRVTHSSNYSVNQLTVADQLANKFQMNIISHHEHHLAKGWDRYKRFCVVNNGALVDPEKLAYVVLDDSKSPGMANGFTTLINGVAQPYGKYPFTDWEAVG